MAYAKIEKDENGQDEIIVYIGYNAVVIDKEIGPTIFAPLRITPDSVSGDWIIQREWIKTAEWIEWCRIPGQIEQEFTRENE